MAALKQGSRFRLRVRYGKKKRFTDIEVPATYYYEGPFGPITGDRGVGALSVSLSGPNIGHAEIAWGPGSRNDGNWPERIKDGIPARVGDRDLRVYQPKRGLRRSGRALWVDCAGRPAALLRLRRTMALSLERADGAPLMRLGGAFGLSSRSGVTLPEADAVDVAVFLLVYQSGLGSEIGTGLPLPDPIS